MFRELDSPTKNQIGWYIATRTIDNEFFGWLTTDGNIDFSAVSTDQYYYDSEANAFAASCGYYNGYGEPYPYIIEAVNAASKANGSQVMEFE